MAFQHLFSSRSWKPVATAVSDRIFLFTFFFCLFFFFFSVIILLLHLESFPLILAVFAHEGRANEVQFLPTVKLSPSIT